MNDNNLLFYVANHARQGMETSEILRTGLIFADDVNNIGKYMLDVSMHVPNTDTAHFRVTIERV